MAVIVGIVSQKGGVGKSTLARVLAREYAAKGWQVLLADLDPGQATSFNWEERRRQRALEPALSIEQFDTAEKALVLADLCDLVILDGPPRSTAGTLKIAQASNLLLLPTGLAIDDLEPTVLLAHELVQNGIPKSRFVFVLCRVGESELEIKDAREYIQQAGYAVLEESLPEKTAYRRASDAGGAITETHFASLNEKASRLVQALMDRIKKRS